MIARVHRAPFIAVMAMGFLAVGCGSGRSTTHASTHAVRRPPRASANPAPPPVHALPTPGPTGVPAAAAAIGVIRAWSDALRQGDVRDAARYFALPSVMVNGSVGAGTALVITIETRAQAEAANVSLPCGARFVSADQRGRYVNALFALTGRPGPGGGDCGTGVGQTARTNFVIAHGRIIEWLRAPDDPGDNGTPGVPTPTTPPSPQAPGATV